MFQDHNTRTIAISSQVRQKRGVRPLTVGPYSWIFGHINSVHAHRNMCVRRGHAWKHTRYRKKILHAVYTLPQIK